MSQKTEAKGVEKIMISVTRYEAAMILKLRQYDFGSFKVQRTNGNPVRVIVEASELLTPEDGDKLLLSSK